ncbi:unnamed protein product [Ceutorhynchus assimilis]|uniref:H15 domain-containing protein n=1 Tax=Ceutorhynchus assimilis TaxID=467358 RepID=A0A9N9MR44_9CUCU|nr:unnamed protein product [Ceutorhynchus assimilis]
MKMTRKEPRFLATVMEAIASMKEKTGSTRKKIINHVTYSAIKTKVTVQVQKALEHAVNEGLVKHHRGKYALRLNTEDSDTLRRTIQTQNFYEVPASSGRLRRTKRGKSIGKKNDSHRRSRRKWKRNTYPEESRRRSSKRRRGHSEQGKIRVQVETGGNKANEVVNDPCQNQTEEKNQPQVDKKESLVKPSSNSNQNNNEERKHGEEQRDITCGNPNCLCTITDNDSNLN